MKEHRPIHPAIKDLKHNVEEGKLSRREFLRYASLLGMSAVAASQMIGMGSPRKAFAGDIQRGGSLKVASPVHKVTHPAQISWIAPSQQLRLVAEYLTYTDGNNVTHPHLLENWEASEDLKTWTLNLRQGVTFNNGDPFVADDVVFTMMQWLSEDVGSSMMGMIGGYLSPDGIEKVSDTQVKLHLKQPEIGVPEHFFHYPALVVNHRTFEGDFIKAPHGTGPFTLESYVESERSAFKARSDYWNAGADGNPLPYLDSVEFIDMGTEMAPQIAAIQAGEIDMIDFGDISGVEAFNALKGNPDVNIFPATTNQTRVLRMRVDLKPWDDERVRMALKLCQHREKILGLSYFGEGIEGQDVHVSPKHPEYCPMETPAYNPEKAKQLLAEAGYPNGVDVNIAVGSGWKEIVRYAEILKQDAMPAGFRINIQTMPNSQYWEKWKEVDLGITTWAHRPLGTMVLNLAYTSDADGNPVPWNETRWVDKEFDQLLMQANGTLDLEKRREIFCKLQKVQQERGPIGLAFWINVWKMARKRVQGIEPHPSLYMKLDETWVNA